jgi:hypothetical protein
MEWIWRDRQTKYFPGPLATNKPFEVSDATVVDLTDGKISRDSDYWDLPTYMKQVGLTKPSNRSNTVPGVHPSYRLTPRVAFRFEKRPADWRTESAIS